jgi:hypothetical protein
MSIKYYVTENKLTSPISYYCRVSASELLDYPDVAKLINAKVSNIPEATALTVLQTLREVVKEQLLAGNTVNLTNFISFVTSIPGKLTNPLDPVPASKLSTLGKVSSTLRDEVRQSAEFERAGYTTKEPSIIQVADFASGLANVLRTTLAYDVFGSNIKFNIADQEQGIFLEDVREQAYAGIGNAKISAVCLTSLIPISEGYANEFTLSVKTKYTESGTIRTTAYKNPVRIEIAPGAGERDIFYSYLDGTNTWFGTITSATVDSGNPHGVVVLRKDQYGVITGKIGTYVDGSQVVYGNEVVISGNGLVSFPATGEVSAFNVTIKNFSQIDALMTKYSGQLIEPIVFYTIAAP